MASERDTSSVENCLKNLLSQIGPPTSAANLSPSALSPSPSVHHPPTDLPEGIDPRVIDLQKRYSFLTVAESINNLTLSPSQYCSLISHIVTSSDTAWLFPSQTLERYPADENENTRQNVYFTFVDSVREMAVVPTFPNREDCGYESKDFKGVVDRASDVMKCLCKLLVGSPEGKRGEKLRRKISGVAIVLCAEHSDSTQPWTSEECTRSATNLVDAVCQTNGCVSLEDYLRKNTEAGTVFFTDVLPKLAKTSWKLSPAAPVAFEYILVRVKRPNVGENLHLLLPPSLLFLDDFQTENKFLGLRCLAHIIDNSSKAELRCLGRIDVIFDTLQKLLYLNDAAVLDRLIPVIIGALSIYEKTSGMHPYDRTDDILHRYLHDAYMSSNNTALRAVYAMHLASLVDHAGLKVVRHTGGFVKVLEEYLQVYEGTREGVKLNVLRALKTFIQVAKPRVPRHSNSLAKPLLRLIYDISVNQATTSEDTQCDYTSNYRSALLELSGDCLRTICQTAKSVSSEDSLRQSIEKLCELNLDNRFTESLRTVCFDKL
jgi:hypothetical protein